MNNDVQQVKNSDCQHDDNAVAGRWELGPQRSRYANANAEQLILHTEAGTVTDGRGEEEREVDQNLNQADENESRWKDITTEK